MNPDYANADKLECNWYTLSAAERLLFLKFNRDVAVHSHAADVHLSNMNYIFCYIMSVCKIYGRGGVLVVIWGIDIFFHTDSQY